MRLSGVWRVSPTRRIARSRIPFWELLAVRPGSRGLGIGTRLIEEFAAAAARMGASSVHLMVAPAEKAGLAAFYRARGFQAIEEGHWERHLT